jgi:hypothetical protein
MNHSAEYEAERLDRLERESRRRRWDSVLLARARDSATAPTDRPNPPAEPAPDPDTHAVLELLVDRIERIERLAARLDSEVRGAERRSRRRTRIGLAALGVGLAVAASAPLAGRLLGALAVVQGH